MGRISTVVNSQCIHLCPRDIYELAVLLKNVYVKLKSSLQSKGAVSTQTVASLDVQN